MNNKEPIRKVSLSCNDEHELNLAVDKLKELLNFRGISFSALDTGNSDIVMKRIRKDKLYVYIYTDNSEIVLFYSIDIIRKLYDITCSQEVDVLKYSLRCENKEYIPIFLRVLRNFICLEVENAKFELDDSSLILLNPNDVDTKELNRVEFKFNDLVRDFEIIVNKE